MMLLPSPFPCDARRPGLPRFAHYNGRSRSVSPAPEQCHTLSSTTDISSISSTCRALHVLLGVQPQPKATPAPLATTTPKPSKKTSPANRIVKRPPLPPRGHNKRRRSIYEADIDCVSDRDATQEENHEYQENIHPATPKRQCRRAPTHIPFGLERKDFYDLPVTPPPAGEVMASEDVMDEDDDTPKARQTVTQIALQSMTAQAAYATPKRSTRASPPWGSLTPRQAERALVDTNFDTPLLRQSREQSKHEYRADVHPTDVHSLDEDNSGCDWSLEDDCLLVDLVLDKLRLSRRQWNECARQMGADQRSLGARWKFLLDEGKVGLKMRRGGRAKRADVREMWS